MSVRIMAAVWENGPESPEDLLLLLAIADHANDDGYSYPGLDRLARKCRVTDRTVRRTLRRLETAGWLETKIGGGRSHTNLYRVVVNPDAHVPLSSGNPDVGDTKGDVDDMERGTPTSPEPSVEPSKKQRARHTPFPDGFQPDADLVEWTRKNAPGIDPKREWAKFHDHAIATDRRLADWRRAWMMWARKAQEWAERDKARFAAAPVEDLDYGRDFTA
jgi:hypothetical protein